MPKNKGKGGKNRRRGKNENEGVKRELIFRDEGQQYAQVTKMLGNGRVEAMGFDGVKRICHIRGKLRKKVWINVADIILLGLRDYQDAKADVILKYSADEARNLKSYGEFPDNVKINETVTFSGETGLDDEIEFDEVDSGDDDNHMKDRMNHRGNLDIESDISSSEEDSEDSEVDSDEKDNSKSFQVRGERGNVKGGSNNFKNEKQKQLDNEIDNI